MKTFLRILAVLAILIIIGAIYIATKKSDYDVKRTKIIKAPAAVIFNTVNEYKTWMDWGPWKEEDNTIVPTYPDKTSGVGGGYSWDSKKEGPGRIETVDLVQNSSLNQKIYFDNRGESDVYWRFNPTEEGTEVTWGMKGKLDFISKVFFYVMGGPEKLFGEMFDKGLSNLDNYVQTAVDKHSFTNAGMVEYGGGFYIYTTTECSFKEMPEKMNQMLPEILLYAINRNLPRTGAPFTLYHKYDEDNQRAKFSCCVPVKEKIKSDKIGIETAYLKPGRFHKTIFQGAYKFSQKAWETAFKFLEADDCKFLETGEPFEVYTKGHTDSPNPADWITEIYLPVE